MRAPRFLGPVVRSSALGSLLAVLPSAAVAGNVHVVDANGGGDSTRIQRAIDAASEGDVILVRAGVYPRFTIHDKGLTVVADRGAVVSVVGASRVEDLATGREVRLIGLQFVGSGGGSPHTALRIENDLGSVRVEGCRMNGPQEDPGASLSHASDVVFTRCLSFSGEGVYFGSAFLAQDSTVALYSSGFRGDDSQGALGDPFCDAPMGAHGAAGTNSFIFAAGSWFHGGDGGTGSTGGGLACTWGGPGGDGGDGICLSMCTAWLLDNVYEWGAGGPCAFPGSTHCQPGLPGIAIGCGPATTLGGAARHLSMPNPVREGETVSLTVGGEPGDAVFLFQSDRTVFRFVASYHGVQTTRQPGAPILLGTIPGAATLTVPFPVPVLDPGVEARTIEFQAVHRTPLGKSFLGSPVSLVVLDGAF